MDRRSWPWKRKSSEKASSDFDSVSASISNIGIKQGEQEHTKPVSFIQVSVEKYEHFIGLEEQVLVLNEKLDDTKKNLSSAQADMATKDDIVKQHAKVAEEAISGWEKAEAETLALKHQLESVILLKLTAEEQAAYLDSALKECVKQIRNMKEENEKKLHDVVFTKTKLWEKAKSELEATIAGFERELLKNSAETTAISRSLQERSALLIKISEEKARADTEIEALKTTIQSYEREISSLKYELNVAAKELEIRNEEKNMSVKSAEAANKQHFDDVKKITKLEAECQRLRGLVRKRLPGPAALAQMKLEVERLGHGFGESRGRRQSGDRLSTYPFLSQEANFIEAEHCHKEIEFLTARLLAMEEETKMLKEALSKRNCELQDSASRCAKTANKLRILEAQILILNQQKSVLKSNADISFEGSLSHHESNQSLASMSEDGVDDAGSSAESWASALISELSQFKKDKISNRSKISQSSNQLELMDDFLEMEKLAGLSSENKGVVTVSDEGADDKMKNENCDETSSVDVHMDVCKEKTPILKPNPTFDLVSENQPSEKLLSKIQERIASVIESKVLDSEAGKLVEEIMTIVQDSQRERPLRSKDHINVDRQHSIEVTDYAIAHHDSTEGKLPADYDLSPLISEPEVVNGASNPSSESEAATHNFSIEEFKNLKMERDNMELDLINCREISENVKLQLAVTEQNLAELKLQFSACQKSKDLADTQLRCMTASYKLLETHMGELEAEISLLRSKAEALGSELVAERHSHEDDLAKYDSLQEKMRIMSCSKCSCHSEADAETKARHEREIAAAADKLAECQEAIILINKQLNAMHPPVEATSSSSRFREQPRPVNHNSQQSQYSTMENENISRSVIERVESPSNEYSSQFSTSDMESSPVLNPTGNTKRPKHRSRSTSASSLSSMLNDKSGRGFSRFFSK